MLSLTAAFSSCRRMPRRHGLVGEPDSEVSPPDEHLSREFEPTGRFDRRLRNAVDFATCGTGPQAT
jgi:hypothetical protein